MTNKIQKIQEDFLLDFGRIFIRGEIDEDSEEKFTTSLRYLISKTLKQFMYI